MFARRTKTIGKQWYPSIQTMIRISPIDSPLTLLLSSSPSSFIPPPTLLLSRSFAVTGRHSKNVASKKNALDAAKTKLYARLGIKILMAAKSGGTDPEKNPLLARALREAQQYKLPRDNIEKALKKASDTAMESNFESGTYEIFGHGGVGMIAYTLTDNTNRAIMTIKGLLRKHEVKMASNGSVLFQFDHRAVFLPQMNYDKDILLEKAIEKEIDDLDFISHINGFTKAEGTEEYDYIVTTVEQQTILQEITEELKIPGSIQLAYLPKDLQIVSDNHLESNLQFIEVLEELDDVDTVFHNMQLLK